MRSPTHRASSRRLQEERVREPNSPEGSGSLPWSKNHSSFDAHAPKVRAKFAEEVKLGRMLGPFRNDFLFPNSLFPTDQPWAAPLGAVEKDK